MFVHLVSFTWSMPRFADTGGTSREIDGPAHRLPWFSVGAGQSHHGISGSLNGFQHRNCGANPAVHDPAAAFRTQTGRNYVSFFVLACAPLAPKQRNVGPSLRTRPLHWVKGRNNLATEGAHV